MKKNINTENIEGYLYEIELKEKKVENQSSSNYGKEYITGTLTVATDEDCLNTIPVHYTYVTAMTKSGSPNRSFANLKTILETGKTVVSDGKENATIVKLTPSLALKDFYNQQNQFVASQKNEGGFVTILNNAKDLSPEKERSKFTVDAVLTNVTESDEGNIESIKAGIFNFKNDFLPFTFAIKSKEGSKYFESLDISSSNPVYIKIWGSIKNTVVKKEEIEKSAFGDAAVRTTTKTFREWTITGSSTEPYDFGDEGVMTKEELAKAISERAVMLEDLKQQAINYRNNKNSTSNSSSTNANENIAFKF